MPETFNPLTWVNNTFPAINQNNLNRIEQGIESLDDRTAQVELGIIPPVTVPYATSITINATQGSLFRCVISGHVTLDAIIGGTDGQTVVVEVQASGAPGILHFTGSTASIDIAVGQWWVGVFRYVGALPGGGGSTWLRDDNIGGGSGTGGNDLNILAPQNIPYAAAITLNAATGALFRVTAPGNFTLNAPTNGADGQEVIIEVLAAGGQRVVSLGTGIALAGGSGNAVVAPSNVRLSVALRYNAGEGFWLLSAGVIPDGSITDAMVASGGGINLAKTADSTAGSGRLAMTSAERTLLAGLASRVAALEAGTSPPTAPGAPTIGTANAGTGQATVAFTAPTSNGGSAITSYTVTASPGGVTASGSTSPITVTGLTNGTTYTFTVRATNSAGTGSASAASNSVTPAATGPTPIGLVDDFATQDDAKWVYQSAASVSGGQLRCVSNGAFTGEVRSQSSYDLTGKSFYFELAQAAADGETYASVWHTGPNTNALGWNVTGGSLVAVSRAAGAYTEVQVATYNATNHRWLRISESGGVITWATSPDGASWSTFATAAVPITITTLRVLLGCGGGSTGIAIFDNVNNAAGGGGGSSPATVGSGRVDIDTIA